MTVGCISWDSAETLVRSEDGVSRTMMIDGNDVTLDAKLVRRAASLHHPEPIQVHWIEIDGVRWPPKQLLELATGLPRSRYISHTAVRAFRALGFVTSSLPQESPDHPRRERSVPRDRPARSASAVSDDIDQLLEAVTILHRFMRGADMTRRIADLEHRLSEVDSSSIDEVVRGAGLGLDTLSAALVVRRAFGRVSDVIHASVIALSLEQLLEDGEVVANRPSLAAGNDPTRPFDLETNRRVAEFKVAVWRGADAVRKRGLFADLVHLALDTSGRRRQLFVVGTAPGSFLETSASTASWALGRSSPRLRDAFIERFGSLDITIRDFRHGAAHDVDVVDLTAIFPGIDAVLAAV